jgi:hypothetical protein
MRAYSLLLALPLVLAAQDGATVEGSIKNNLTGTGVASVTVRLNTQQGTHYETTTDESGNYRISGMKSGDYDSSFEKPGFGDVSNPGVFDKRRLHVAPGKDAIVLNHELVPFSKLRGRVLLPDGKPAVNVEVTVANLPANTEADGSFVLDDVLPGSYNLRASPPPKAKPVIRDGVRVEPVTTYYPSVTDRAAAPLIYVTGGSEDDVQDLFQTWSEYSLHYFQPRVLAVCLD